MRVNELLALNEIKALEYRNIFLGKTVDVLIEKVTSNKAFGHSSNYLEVEVSGDNLKENDLIFVKINKIGYPISYGEKLWQIKCF